MEYCPKCKNMLVPQKNQSNTVLRCMRCGYEKHVTNPGAYRITLSSRHTPEKSILVIDKEVKVEVLPKAKAECSNCGHTEAYYWEVQTRAGDEPATRFFKCTKCGHVWREYQ